MNHLDTLLDTLNQNQHKAVSWDDGPLLVLAGPGSGKTRVLTLRVARLIKENSEASVLALTFTNIAAAEMRQRVDQLLGQRADRAHLCTFHSFAADLLRQHGSHLGIRPDFSLMTREDDRIGMLENVIEDLPDSGSPVPADRRNLLRFIDRLFAESYDGGEETGLPGRTPPWVPQLHKRFTAALVAANRLDFGSLLHFARRLLKEKPGVARVLRLGWTHVCVDEFQDTNRAQYDLLRLIAIERRHNLFVVGDDDQIIYQWNGASPVRLKDLRRDYDVEIVQLPESYRCPKPVIMIANRLIAKNVRRTPGKAPIAPAREAVRDGSVVRYGAFRSPRDEATFIPRDIEARNLRPADCVVLGRASKLLRPVAEALSAAGYEAYVARRKNDFEAPAVRLLIDALRLANARHDRDILRRLCLGWESFTGEILEHDGVAAASALTGGDFLRTWAEMASTATSDSASFALDRIRSHLVDSLSFPEIVDWFLDRGWSSWTNRDDEIAEEEVETWRALHTDLMQEHAYGRFTLSAYLQRMDLASKAPQPSARAVRCMTVHGSKGSEFKHVYLIGMAQEVFPSFHALRMGVHSRELEEERRNCFVAITRVEETLTVTWSQEYYGYPKVPSQFLREMGMEVGG